MEAPGGPSINDTRRRVSKQLGISEDTLRNWIKLAQVDAGKLHRITTADSTRDRRLEREVRELGRAKAILKRASAFFPAELDRPSPR